MARVPEDFERTCDRALLELGWTASELVVARRFGDRLLGMLAASARGPAAVMAFPHCSSVHTCLMPHPLDVAFIDRVGRVMALRASVAPWRVASCAGAAHVLERAAHGGARLTGASPARSPRFAAGDEKMTQRGGETRWSETNRRIR